MIRTVFSLIQAHHSRSCSLSTFKTKRIIQTLKFEMNAAVHDQSDRATNHLSVKETVDHEKGEEHNCSESFHIAILADSELPNQSEEIVAKDGETFVVDKKLAIYFHPMCSQHRIPDHPEHHIRVDGILDILRDTWKNSLLFREARAVTDEQILLFHTPAMLKRFRKLADNAQQTYKLKKSVVCLSIDSDTHVMWQTRPAAYYAAGSVLTALDSMYAPPSDPARIDTAFCCVRPPGHHAERNKAGGFCFFNNVAIGARYAQQSLGVERVAVLDFDVHHGNGACFRILCSLLFIVVFGTSPSNCTCIILYVNYWWSQRSMLIVTCSRL